MIDYLSSACTTQSAQGPRQTKGAVIRLIWLDRGSCKLRSVDFLNLRNLKSLFAFICCSIDQYFPELGSTDGVMDSLITVSMMYLINSSHSMHPSEFKSTSLNKLIAPLIKSTCSCSSHGTCFISNSTNQLSEQPLPLSFYQTFSNFLSLDKVNRFIMSAGRIENLSFKRFLSSTDIN